MKRILVLGCPGSGKSYFARKLHQLTKLPLYHLDNIFWKENKTHISKEEFDEKLDVILRQEHWIIDGDYHRTYEVRIRSCDTIFFLNYDEEVCIKGIEERVGKKREDIPWIEEKTDPELIEVIRNYKQVRVPILQDLFQKYPDKRIIVFHTRNEADEYLRDLE